MSENKRIRLGIYYSQFPGWTAYAIYLSNLIFALNTLENAPKIIFLRKSGTVIDSSIPSVDEIVVLPEENPIPSWMPEIAKKIIIKIRVRLEPSLVDRVCLENKMDVLFSHCTFKPDQAHRVPVISWIPDFQHVHLPQIFSEDEISVRNQEFKDVADKSDCIILSSLSALKDLINFVPDAKEKSAVVSFVTQINSKIYERSPDNISSKYFLPEKFFFLPSQFWMHKNHKIVIEALALIHQSDPEIKVVCSGGVNDYRSSLYFSDLLFEISKNGLRDNFIILGLIPYSDVHLLMRQACAILQPSLFEGWSTTVEEAKSLGKPLILSDIPVHREQNPPESWYFDPKDANNLSKIMTMTYNNISAGPNLRLENIAHATLPSRTREYAMNFMKAVELVTNHSNLHKKHA